MKKKDHFTYSIIFTVFLFLVMAAGAVAGALSIPAVKYLRDKGGYTSSFEDFVKSSFEHEAYRHLNAICADKVTYPTRHDIEVAFDKEKSRYNVGYVIKRRGYQVWSNTEGKESIYDFFCVVTHTWPDGYYYKTEDYSYTMYVYDDFEKPDVFSMIYRLDNVLYQYRSAFLYVMIISVLIVTASFVWLLCTAGHRRGKEGITPGVLMRVPLDILTGIFFLGVGLACWFIRENVWNVINDQSAFFQEEVKAISLFAVFVIFEVVWATVFFRELTRRIKLKKWWRKMVLIKAAALLWKWLKKLGAFLLMLVTELPVIVKVAVGVAVITVCEFLCMLPVAEVEQYVPWFLEKLILIPVTLYIAMAFKRLQMGSEALAEGNLSYKLDMKWLVLDFKKHGENLNRIGEGIARAVEQRMQSEHLKTELITNVSHDIKTPLTSVINYADLLGSMAQEKETELDRGKVEEYSEVLLRQSKRLKKLLDDLLEASKATTGNLEVNLAPCEISVLLAQAAGEYESRFEAEDLKLVMHQPEETIRIMADGRHIWRVFDNLFNNICKYAQEGSRVYLNVEKRGERVEVIFRNMSKYELNISPQELEERFVRGDKSRNLEGNGLGLSIAKSLVELQHGTMQIVTDGDLFKVIIGFAVLEEAKTTG